MDDSLLKKIDHYLQLLHVIQDLNIHQFILQLHTVKLLLQWCLDDSILHVCDLCRDEIYGEVFSEPNSSPHEVSGS